MKIKTVFYLGTTFMPLTPSTLSLSFNVLFLSCSLSSCFSLIASILEPILSRIEIFEGGVAGIEIKGSPGLFKFLHKAIYTLSHSHWFYNTISHCNAHGTLGNAYL